MLTPLPAPVVAAFAALAVAMAALWAPRVSPSPQAYGWWVLPFAAALLLALGSGLVNTWGLGVLFAFVTACRLGHHAPDGMLRGFALAVMLALSAGVLLHVLPGVENPRLLHGVRISADSAPYTKYLNFDKGVMGLLLLGLYARRRTSLPSRVALHDLLVRCAVVIAVVLAATVVLGFARWDPKLPPWWPLWLASMLFLTALPEEALFRHVVQGGLHDWLGDSVRARWTATVAAGALFGLAHAGGGSTYVVLAALAGVGYGWIYAVSGSLGAAILAHTGLNLVHLLFFSYPALERAA